MGLPGARIGACWEYWWEAMHRVACRWRLWTRWTRFRKGGGALPGGRAADYLPRQQLGGLFKPSNFINGSSQFLIAAFTTLFRG